MKNYAQIGDIDPYSLHNIFIISQLLRNHQILQHIKYSFLYLKVLVKPELCMVQWDMKIFHLFLN